MFEYIVIERTACYGTCPVYKVKANRNGKVEYDGIQFVREMGTHQWKISEDDINKINELIETFNYRDFVYDIEFDPTKGWATDHPSCITTVKFEDGEIKTIDHYLGFFGVDERLTEFEKNVEKSLNVIKYVLKH